VSTTTLSDDADTQSKKFFHRLHQFPNELSAWTLPCWRNSRDISRAILIRIVACGGHIRDIVLELAKLFVLRFSCDPVSAARDVAPQNYRDRLTAPDDTSQSLQEHSTLA
jgi:hypothetical protein